VIRVRLREVMQRHERGGGERLTYALLAKKTGLSRATLEAMGSRSSYNPRLSTIDSLCTALDCTPKDLLDYSPGNVRNRSGGRR
jgi:putative transcriptional regulator